MGLNRTLFRRTGFTALGDWVGRPSSDPNAITAALGCIYLLLINFVSLFGYVHQKLPLIIANGLRALLMVLVLALLPVRRYLGAYLHQPRRSLFVILGVIAALESARSVALPYFMPHVDRTHAVESALIACIALTFAIDFPDGNRRWISAARHARWLCVAAMLLVCFANAVLKPKVFDIADTSVSAVKALSSELNPYKLNIDEFGKSNTGDKRFTGYKYSPLLPIVYLPAVTLFGRTGVLISNSIALLLTTLTVRALCRRILSGDGVWAAVLFLATPLVGMSVLVYQVNDLLAMLPICAAFLVWNSRRPGLAGLLIGVSASIKILPAPIAGAALLPRDLGAARRFVIGVIVGLIPIFLFTALDPLAFFNNVILFEIVRPPFQSSWLLHMPPGMIWLLRIAFFVSVLAMVSALLIRDASIDRRMIVYIILICLLLATSQINQDYYWLWWLPLFIPLLCAKESTVVTSAKVNG
jgi:Glycosyltransferase family 87